MTPSELVLKLKWLNFEPIFIPRSTISNSCEIDCSRYNDLLESSLKQRAERFEFLVNFLYSSPTSKIHFYPGDYAIIDLTVSDKDHRKLIGDSGQNMVNKTLRLGCHFSEIKAENHYSAIREILTSKERRSGGLIKEEWRDENYKIPVWTRGLCFMHSEKIFGVFLKEKLLAFATLRFFGEISYFNFLMGHADFLDEGVMYYLISEIRHWLRFNRPEVQYLQYTWTGAPSYANYFYFKKNCGFRAKAICLTQTLRESIALSRLASNQDRVVENEIEAVVNKAQKNKLFKITAIDAFVDEISETFPLLIKHNKLDSNLSDATFHAARNSFREFLECPPHEYTIKNFTIHFKDGSDSLSCINLTSLRDINFRAWAKNIRPKISPLMKRGDILFLFIRSEKNQSIDFRKKQLLEFKNTDFQVTARFYNSTIDLISLIKI